MQPEEYGAMFRVEETHWWYQALHRLIFQTLESELPDWHEKEILDAGCGTGSILQQLGNPAKNVGVDLASEAVSFCRQRGLTNVQQASDLLQRPLSPMGQGPCCGSTRIAPRLETGRIVTTECPGSSISPQRP